jgi:nucleoside-diphosphate-sugar epimerase
MIPEAGCSRKRTSPPDVAPHCAAGYHAAMSEAIGAPPPRRILVLGHSGFIGTHLMAHLAAAFPAAELTGRSFPECDLTTPGGADSLSPLIDRETAVVVLSGIKKQHGDTLDTFSRNVAIGVNLGALLGRRPSGRTILVSTADVYGEERQNTAIDEATPVGPTSYYGMAKYAVECLLAKAAATGQVGPLSILRLPFVYGPGDAAGIYGPLGFIAAARAGEPIVLWGEGDERREFLYVGDLVGVIGRLLASDQDGVLNVVSGRSRTFREVADVVASLAGPGTVITTRPRSRLKVDNAFTGERMRRHFPAFAFTPLEEGIRAVWDATVPGERRP